MCFFSPDVGSSPLKLGPKLRKLLVIFLFAAFYIIKDSASQTVTSTSSINPAITIGNAIQKSDKTRNFLLPFKNVLHLEEGTNTERCC